MRKGSLIAAVAASCLSMACAAPAFAATASNSQNGTDSSNPNATDGPPTSASAVPATDMQMGAQPGAMPMQNGTTMNGGTAAPDGTVGDGSGTAATPKP